MTYTEQDFDNDVKRYLQLEETRVDIVAEQDAIKNRIRALGVGAHHTPSGIGVKVASPNRRFNLDTATRLLPPEVLEQCRAEGFDPAKVKRFLSPELLDMCMDVGSGDPRVSIG